MAALLLQKRGQCVGRTKRGKGTKWMVVVDGQGIPLANHLDSASPSKVTLLEKTLIILLCYAKVTVGRGKGPGD
jgi:hypothetical protein